jgi:hypothetical protein
MAHLLEYERTPDPPPSGVDRKAASRNRWPPLRYSRRGSAAFPREREYSFAYASGLI